MFNKRSSFGVSERFWPISSPKAQGRVLPRAFLISAILVHGKCRPISPASQSFSKTFLLSAPARTLGDTCCGNPLSAPRRCLLKRRCNHRNPRTPPHLHRSYRTPLANRCSWRFRTLVALCLDQFVFHSDIPTCSHAVIMVKEWFTCHVRGWVRSKYLNFFRHLPSNKSRTSTLDVYFIT